MPRSLRPIVLILSFIAICSLLLSAQEATEAGWRISPNRINIQMGADRPLQLLDDNAQELHGAQWSVDNPDLADLQEEDWTHRAARQSRGYGPRQRHSQR